MTPKQRRLIFILAGVSAVIALAGIGGMTWWMIRNFEISPKATGDEKRLVLTAAAFEPYGIESWSPQAESFSSMRQLGLRSIHYDYDSRKAPGVEDYLVLMSSTEVHSQTMNARQSFQMQKIGMKAGTALAGGSKLVEVPSLLAGTGDDRYAAILKNDRGNAGNIFIVRQGRAVFTITIGGVYFDDPEDAKELLAPLIEESKKWTKK